MSEASFNEGASEGAPVAQVLTAFTVIVDKTGKAWTIADLPEGIVMQFPPSARAIKAACIEIAHDIQASNTAAFAALMAPAPEPTVGERIGSALASRRGE